MAPDEGAGDAGEPRRQRAARSEPRGAEADGRGEVPPGAGTPGHGGQRARRVLVVFAGDGTAESTLPTELRARGAHAEAIDIALGGTEHDVLRPEVARRLLRAVSAGAYDAVFAAPPCASFSVAHRPQLRSRGEPEGVAHAPPEW
eukprot:1047653-Pleurochrysis_carterae.AAC.1